MILSLLGMLGGGFMRLLPELIAFFNKKTDNSHELAMLDKQFQLETTRSESRRAEQKEIAAAHMEEVTYQGDNQKMLALLDAQKSALEGQMQKIGVWWVDALNFLVRPLATYYVLLMYGAAKVAMFMVALKSGIGGWEAILKIYDPEDRAILSGILAFWFVGRVFDKKQ
jgi:hypothetical protein